MTRVPVLKNRVQGTDVIAESDIDWVKTPARTLRRNTVADARDLVGKSPRHVISPGRPIRLDEIAGASIVNKGTQVTLLYKTHNIEIKTFGEALEPGAKGDVIRVRNSASKTVIQGTVESAGHVRVASPDSDAAGL
jgi:flagella basal body P-ring formation protein FlgA